MSASSASDAPRSPRYRRAVAITVLLGAANAWTLGAFAYRPTSGTQFLAMLLIPAVFLAAVSWLWVGWRAFRRQRDFMAAGLGAALLSLGACWAAPCAGNELADRWFFRERVHLETVVSELRARPDRRYAAMPDDSLPAPLRGRFYRVASRHREDGTFQVWFIYGYGFPMMHSAYAYNDGPKDRLRPPHGPWSSGRRLTSNWYDVSG